MGKIMILIIDFKVAMKYLKWLNLKKNRNIFNFFSQGVEIQFFDFCLSHFEQVLSFLGSNGTSDEIDSQDTSDNSASFGANDNVQRQD